MSTDPAHPDHRHDAYAALRSPNYRAFAAGFACSSMGLQMLATGLAWEIYERTGSAWLLGCIGLARSLPVVLLALPAGHASDIFSRKWIIVVSQGSLALTAFAMMVWSHEHGPLWAAYALVVVMGCTRAFNGPARGSILPLIVPKHDFPNAVTWNSSVFQASGVLGPLAAGLLISAFHAAWPVYACCALGTLIMFFSGMFIRPLEAQLPGGKFTVTSMLSGLGYLRRERVVFGAILIDCLGVLLGGATALLPVYAKDILHVGPDGLGLLKSAPYIGAFVMSLFLAHRRPFERTGPVFLGAVALWAACIIGFGLSTRFWFSMFFLAAEGAIDTISVVIRHVLVQVRTPDSLRGRVSAVNSMFIEMSNELGGFESGAVAALAGPVAAVVSGGLGTLAVLGAVSTYIPELRTLGRLDEHHMHTHPPAAAHPEASAPLAP